MTLNQVVTRIKALALAHKQVRNFYQGLTTDFLAAETTNYPSVFLTDNGGKISTAGQATTLAFKLFFLDLTNLSENSNENVLDVQSDMISVAMDIVAEMNAGYFDDWALSTDNNLQLVTEGENDSIAGVVMDFSLRLMFKQNLCQIPTELITGSPMLEDMKLVYDLEYIATGAEGLTINIPGIVGKRILLIVRENNPLHKVSNNPGSTNYVWDNTNITLGTPTVAGERFLILYRNY